MFGTVYQLLLILFMSDVWNSLPAMLILFMSDVWNSLPATTDTLHVRYLE
jgi:hypothetical protein